MSCKTLGLVRKIALGRNAHNLRRCVTSLAAKTVAILMKLLARLSLPWNLHSCTASNPRAHLSHMRFRPWNSLPVGIIFIKILKSEPGHSLYLSVLIQRKSLTFFPICIYSFSRSLVLYQHLIAISIYLYIHNFQAKVSL